eukprot:6862725-Alexandrium_andersonii.AAC.1
MLRAWADVASCPAVRACAPVAFVRCASMRSVFSASRLRAQIHDSDGGGQDLQAQLQVQCGTSLCPRAHFGFDRASSAI